MASTQEVGHVHHWKPLSAFEGTEHWNFVLIAKTPFANAPCSQHPGCLMSLVGCDCGASGIQFSPSGELIWTDAPNPALTCTTHDRAPTHPHFYTAYAAAHHQSHGLRKASRS